MLELRNIHEILSRIHVLNKDLVLGKKENKRGVRSIMHEELSPHGQCRIRNDFVIIWAPWNDIMIKKLTVMLCRLANLITLSSNPGKVLSEWKKYVTRWC